MPLNQQKITTKVQLPTKLAPKEKNHPILETNWNKDHVQVDFATSLILMTMLPLVRGLK
jgi:hypothetical protein